MKNHVRYEFPPGWVEETYPWHHGRVWFSRMSHILFENAGRWKGEDSSLGVPYFYLGEERERVCVCVDPFLVQHHGLPLELISTRARSGQTRVVS